MVKFIVGVVVFVFVAFGLVLLSNNSMIGRKRIEDLPPNTTIVDVRLSSEYANGHVKGAVNFPVLQLQSGELPNVATSEPIAVYGRTINNSSDGVNVLKQAGFTNVIDLGSMADVEASKMEMETN